MKKEPKKITEVKAEEKTANPSPKPNLMDKFLKKKEKSIDLNKNINSEFKKLDALREKKIFSKRKKQPFTIRGFIKAINLQENLEKAGVNADAKVIAKNITRIDLVICIIVSIAIFVFGLFSGKSMIAVIIFLIAFWLTVSLLIFALIWIAFLVYLDTKIFQRTKAVELVFPDFLELASSNISAGMPVDQALWYAVRPNFGVLAKEIETVAKNTMAGEDLATALQTFARKYDSKIIQRSVNLMLEGLAAGGEMADLLSKIALDIEETRLIKQDMAANVTTYVIFITFATIVAAPVLFGLATQLLVIIKQITSNMTASTGGGSSLFSMSFSSEGIKVTDFKIFSYVTLTISAAASACIVSVIQKGRIKEGLSKIPIFIVVSLLIYSIASVFMGSIFGGLF